MFKQQKKKETELWRLNMGDQKFVELEITKKKKTKQNCQELRFMVNFCMFFNILFSEVSK